MMCRVAYIHLLCHHDKQMVGNTVYDIQLTFWLVSTTVQRRGNAFVYGASMCNIEFVKPK